MAHDQRSGPAGRVAVDQAVCACCESCADAPAAALAGQWLRAARLARWLAWTSLAWMTAEGVLGLVAGVTAGSVALVGWALGSVIEGDSGRGKLPVGGQIPPR